MIYANDYLRRFNRMFCELGALYHESALKFGLTDSAMEVLYSICTEGDGCLISEIIDQTLMSKQTINSALRRLEGEGVIRLEADGGRRKRVFLTERGKELCDQTAGQVIEVENGIFDSWEQEDCERCMELMQRYVDGFRKGGARIK